MIKKLRLAIVGVAAVAVVGATTPVQAQGFLGGLFGGGGGGSSQGGSDGGDCGGTQTHLVSCDGEAGVGAIGDLIRITLIIMTVLIGVVATGAIAYAGALYAMARDDREKVSQAITIIRNVVIGILMYVFTLAIINWLIPTSVIEAPPAQTTSPSVVPTGSPNPSATPTLTITP
jgi:heme/copper-type cytochrome/quinol oxidase subunit 2